MSNDSDSNDLFPKPGGKGTVEAEAFLNLLRAKGLSDDEIAQKIKEMLTKG